MHVATNKMNKKAIMNEIFSIGVRLLSDYLVLENYELFAARNSLPPLLEIICSV
jgi:hypothetical protein